MPIYEDLNTQQTIIYSYTGGIIYPSSATNEIQSLHCFCLVYVLSGIKNLNGTIFSFAMLFVNGYANMVNTLCPMPQCFTIEKFIRVGACSYSKRD
jgi:hypothetical protein